MNIAAKALRSPGEVLSFWFGDRSSLNTKANLGRAMQNWYAGKGEFEQTQLENKELVDLAIKGALIGGEWDTSNGALAKIILTDQFARVVYARKAEAFSGEPVALESCYKLLGAKWLEDLDVIAAERLFAVTPLLHSENAADHLTLASLLPTLSSLAPDEIREMATPTAYATDHYAVIQRFGRYPSRNAALGRANTPEEDEYLSSPDLPGWAKSQMKA
jgi:uncharacterized protein (DUF924 family)